MKRTGPHTPAAADTFNTVMQYYPVTAFFLTAYRTNPHTFRGNAMITGHGQKSLFPAFFRQQAYTPVPMQGVRVLMLAGQFAGPAAYTA